MGFWKSTPGVVLLLLSLAALLVVATGMVQVHRATHPPRPPDKPVDFESMMMQVEEVAFPAADGVHLTGWLLRGDAGRAPVILCHDVGGSKTSMLNLMIRLNRSGFPVLAFDFRGHGDAGGNGSTLGLAEKRDVLGAVEFLVEHASLDSRRLGVYGVGMGAHAAVLAAADRPAIGVLVLDGLYPDVGFSLTRQVFRGWAPGIKYLGFLPRSIFALENLSDLGDGRAADTLPRLVGRHLLLLSPAGDALLAAEMERMYATIPEQRDADGNLVTLPATRAGGLYGRDVERYHERVASFFEQRLR